MTGDSTTIGSVRRGHRVGLELYDGGRLTGVVRRVREHSHLELRCRRWTIQVPVEAIRRMVRL